MRVFVVSVRHTDNLDGERSVDRSVRVDSLARVSARVVHVQPSDLQFPAANSTLVSNLTSILITMERGEKIKISRETKQTNNNNNNTQSIAQRPSVSCLQFFIYFFKKKGKNKRFDSSPNKAKLFSNMKNWRLADDTRKRVFFRSN